MDADGRRRHPRSRRGPRYRPGGHGYRTPPAVRRRAAPARRACRPHRPERLADRALALNPAAPGWYLLAKGTAAFGAGDYEAAVEALRAAPPGFAERPFFLAAAHAMLGDVQAARAAADELRAMLPDFDLDLYLKTWPAPGLQQRLHDGAVGAGLGAPPAGH